jgi:hypothetical protein
MVQYGVRSLARPDSGLQRQLAIGDAMPSLFRFFVVLLLLGAVGAAAMVYLATFVEPNTREMTVRVPPDRLGQ